METDGRVKFHELFKYADSTDMVLMLVGMVSAVASGVSQAIMMIIFGQLITAFGDATHETVLHRVNKVALDYVYLGIGTGIVSFLQVSCWTMTGERQATRIRSLYLKSVLRQDIAFFDLEMTAGQVISCASADTVLIQGAIGDKVGKFAQLVTTFLGGLTVAFVKGWLLTLVMLSTVPLFIVAGRIVSGMHSKISGEGQESYTDAGDVVEQTVGSIRTVVSFNGEKEAVSRYNNQIKKAYKATVWEGAAQGFGAGSLSFIYFSTFGLVIWYGTKLIQSRGYNGGHIISILFAVMVGGRALGDAAPCLSAFTDGRAAAHRLFKTIKRKPEIDSDAAAGMVLEDIKGDMELKDVYFSYPSRPGQLIFNGLSLQVSSGKTMALVGESGSGKSSVINLVERFYDPQAGEVCIDGINIKRFKLDWIRQKIGLVSQEPLLFTTSIKENISYGKEDATVEEVKRAAELANAATFINNLPNGYEATVGQHGTQLSGGQKQRIAIARAILKTPRILLLDEATSALDLESERIVQNALNRLMVDRTTLIVAHRLSTVKNANYISVVHHGKIIEQGHHDELMKDPDGAYSQLIRLQEAHHEYGYQVDAGISHSRPIRSQSLRQSTSSPAGSISWRTMALPPSLTVSNESVKYNDTNSDKKNDDSKTLKEAPIGRLLSLNKPETSALVFGSLAAAIHGAIIPTTGLVLASAAIVFYEPLDKRAKDSRFWSLVSVGLGTVSMVSRLANGFLFAIAGGKLIERVRALTFQSIVHQEVAWFDDSINSSGALGGRLCIDVLNLRCLVGDNLAVIIQCTASLFSGIVIAMISDWKVSIVIMAVIPLIGLQGYAQVKFLKGFSQDAKMMYEEASQVAADAVVSIKTVASFCAQKRVVTVYNNKCQASKIQGIRTGIVGGLGFGFSNMIVYTSSALCYFVAAQFISHGKSTFPSVFKAFLSLLLAMIGLSEASTLASDTKKAKDAATSIFSIIDKKSKIDSSTGQGLILDPVNGDIDFNHISFKYPCRLDIQIFSDFTLNIPSGKNAALVGPSGSGKSTIIALLERFYDPDSGTILLDGVDIKNLKVSWLRNKMGLVSQEPILFNDTIRANIAYGKHEVTEEEIVKASMAANAHEFISSMPQGYNTVVGERGTQLSGGQKQRIAIARAILKDPRILLLDEATSALDAESERVVQDTLNQAVVGRTIITVAHRLSTIQGADMIAVLKDGMIVEKGTHEALMGIEGGVYASFLELRSATA
ncbi:unnamed protein product [Urochloa humidicola]